MIKIFRSWSWLTWRSRFWSSLSSLCTSWSFWRTIGWRRSPFLIFPNRGFLNRSFLPVWLIKLKRLWSTFRCLPKTYSSRTPWSRCLMLCPGWSGVLLCWGKSARRWWIITGFRSDLGKVIQDWLLLWHCPLLNQLKRKIFFNLQNRPFVNGKLGGKAGESVNVKMWLKL